MSGICFPDVGRDQLRNISSVWSGKLKPSSTFSSFSSKLPEMSINYFCKPLSGQESFHISPKLVTRSNFCLLNVVWPRSGLQPGNEDNVIRNLLVWSSFQFDLDILQCYLFIICIQRKFNVKWFCNNLSISSQIGRILMRKSLFRFYPKYLFNGIQLKAPSWLPSDQFLSETRTRPNDLTISSEFMEKSDSSPRKCN